MQKHATTFIIYFNTHLLVRQHDLLALGPVGHNLPEQVGVPDDVRVGQPLRQGIVRPADAVETFHHLVVDGLELGGSGDAMRDK